MDSPNMEKQPLLETQEPSGPEPTLHELQQDVFKAQRRYMRAWSRSTSGVWHKRIMLGVTALLVSFMALMVTLIAADALADDSEGWTYPGRVPLEAHIMSKCPDARDCLHDLILPAMQKVSNKVDFKLSYIGTTTDHDDGVVCMHGQEECLGNIIELCAAHLYPDPKIYLGFTMCLTREYQKIPERALLEDCALEHGIDFERLNKCTTDEDGQLAVDRLKASFNHSSSVNVTKSCTIRLNNKVRCIRDGGEWTDCEGGSKPSDLVQDIMDLSASYY
ncbi:putative gamma interferon inducible lysosomal thiol reductase GILT [Septoria linicola]|nr:putative gamma interferon inducible lysosomal thiol reductase GILT [Septoria linicola]